MGKTYSVYLKDDELTENVDELIERGRFHNQAHFFTEACEMLVETEDLEDSHT